MSVKDAVVNRFKELIKERFDSSRYLESERKLMYQEKDLNLLEGYNFRRKEECERARLMKKEIEKMINEQKKIMSVKI